MRLALAMSLLAVCLPQAARADVATIGVCLQSPTGETPQCGGSFLTADPYPAGTTPTGPSRLNISWTVFSGTPLSEMTSLWFGPGSVGVEQYAASGLVIATTSGAEFASNNPGAANVLTGTFTGNGLTDAGWQQVVASGDYLLASIDTSQELPTTSTADPAPVPEPAGLSLLAFAAVVLGAIRRWA